LVALGADEHNSSEPTNGLKECYPVLRDEGVTRLSTFLSLNEEDFYEMPFKRGHQKEMLKWRNFISDSNRGKGNKVDNKQPTTTKTVKVQNFDCHPSITATQADWGRPEYAHCVQPYSWAELIHGDKDKNMSTLFEMGGLGKLLEVNGYEKY